MLLVFTSNSEHFSAAWGLTSSQAANFWWESEAWRLNNFLISLLDPKEQDRLVQIKVNKVKSTTQVLRVTFE